MNKLNFILIIFIILILSLTIRGIAGNPNAEQLRTPSWMVSGPFELSPERGRFALTYSLVEDRSLFFSVPLARFVAPDLGYIHGKYVSLFAPAVSFLVVPGYILGKFLGFSQVGTFAVVAFFAVLNAWFIYAIAMRLGASPRAAWLGALVFLFATPAFAYAVNLYQHHITVFLILLEIYILLRWNNFLSLIIFWFFYAVAVCVDYPNLLLMLPLAAAALSRLVIIRKYVKKLTLSFNLKWLIAVTATVLPFLFFLWFNAASYGNAFQLSGTIDDVWEIDNAGNPVNLKTVGVQSLQKATSPALQQKSAEGFFQTRNLFNGFYIHTVSPDRGILYFTPVVGLGILGCILAYRRKIHLVPSLITIVGINFILYSMWGDPWGGWAFGSRYLIPSYAILSIFITITLTRFSAIHQGNSLHSVKSKKSVLFLALFFIIFIYSTAVNSLGALTSSANPPKIEILQLEKILGKAQKYTYAKNWDLLKQNSAQSFIYQTFVNKYLQAWQYYAILVSLIILGGFILTVSLGFLERQR